VVAARDLALVAAVFSGRVAVRWPVPSRVVRWLVALPGNSCTSTQVHSQVVAVAAFSGRAPATLHRRSPQHVPEPVVAAFSAPPVAKAFVPVAVVKVFDRVEAAKVGRVRCRVDQGRVAVVNRFGPAATTVRIDQTTDPAQITDLERAPAKVAPASGGNPAIGPIIDPIEFRIVTAGTTGETTIGPTSGMTGITTGTTTGTTAITGGTTTGGITITGTIRTIPISITGATPRGRA
jgi:hypothetical protein